MTNGSSARCEHIEAPAWQHFGRLLPAEVDRVAIDALEEAILPNAKLLLEKPMTISEKRMVVSGADVAAQRAEA